MAMFLDGVSGTDRVTIPYKEFVLIHMRLVKSALKVVCRQTIESSYAIDHYKLASISLVKFDYNEVFETLEARAQGRSEEFAK